MTQGRRAATIFVLVAVFIDMLGMGLVFPVLPLLVGDFAPGRAEQAYWVGALTVAYGVMQFLFAPLLGALSDHFGRRAVLILSIVGLGLNYLLIVVAPNLWVLLAARILGGITGATFSVANAYIADISAPEERAKGFGQVGAVFGLGFICGPLMGGVLGEIDLHLPFVAAAGLSFLNALYGLFVLPESLPKERRAPFLLAKANPFAALYALSRLAGTGRLVGIYALYQLAHMILVTTWVLFTHFRFGWGAMMTGLSLFCVGLMSALVQGVLLGPAVKRFGEEHIALAGLGIGVLSYALYGLATEGWMVFAIMFVLGWLGFMTVPSLQALVSRSADPHAQGVTMGSLTAIMSIASVVAPVMGFPILAAVQDFPPADIRVGATFFLCAMFQAVAFALAVPRLLRRSGLPAV